LIDLDDGVEQSNLASDKAKLTLAEANFQRSKNLYVKRIISKSAYDKSFSELAQAKAAVALDKALIAQKHITAPFSGKLGIRQINLGE
jgi:membrane fusion protein (multidrug efflux system)